MRYRTAAILSLVCIAVMFVFPALVEAIFLPSLQRHDPAPLPTYEIVLLELTFFFRRFRLLMPLIVFSLFLVAVVKDAFGRPKGRAADRP
jgi:hypothetical protein